MEIRSFAFLARVSYETASHTNCSPSLSFSLSIFSLSSLFTAGLPVTSLSLPRLSVPHSDVWISSSPTPSPSCAMLSSSLSPSVYLLVFVVLPVNEELQRCLVSLSLHYIDSLVATPGSGPPGSKLDCSHFEPLLPFRRSLPLQRGSLLLSVCCFLVL